MKFAALAVLFALSACMTVPPETTGQVYEITDNMVTIRGAYAMDGSVAKPTPAMVAQAEALCPKAQYMTAVPSRLHQYDDTFLYKFRCPTGPNRG